MAFRSIGIMLTRKCTAACDSCCFECSPESDEELSIGAIKHFLNTTADDETLSTIAFTGGEPFLRFEELCDLIAFVNEDLHKQVSVVTNCFWASSLRRATEVVAQLKHLGLSHISFSCDHYHAKYVPITYVRNALDACHEVGIPIALCSIVQVGESIDDLIADLGDSFYRTMYEVDYCLPAGRAKKAFSDTSFQRTCDPANMKCIFDGSASIGSNGKVYPCCSQTIMDSCIDVGHYKYDSYSTIVGNVENNGLLHLIRYVGFLPFYEYAVNELKLSLPERFVRPCELCQLLFADEAKLDSFAPLIDAEIEKLFKENKEQEEQTC